MRPTTMRDAARCVWAIGFAAMLVVVPFGHAAHLAEPGSVLTPNDVVYLVEGAGLRIGRQVVEAGPLATRPFAIGRMQGEWLWLDDGEARGWTRRREVAFARPWVEQEVALRSLGTTLRIGRTALDTRRNGQAFRVKQMQGTWLWVVGDDIEGWVEKRDVLWEDDAIDHFSRLIRNDPRDSRARYQRGLALTRKELTDLAIADFDEAIRLDPRFAAAYRSRGEARSSDEGHRDHAIFDLSEAIRLDPGDAAARLQRGSLLGINGDHDRAVADLTEAIRLSPSPWTSMAAYLMRAALWKERKDYVRAIADLDAALSFAKQVSLHSEAAAMVHFVRGNVRDKQKERDRALDDYSEVIRLDPWLDPGTIGAAFNNRGLIWLDKHEHDRALADFNSIIRGDALADEATELTRSIRRVSGFKLDDRMIAIGHINRSTIWIHRDDRDQALSDCDEALRLQPDLAFGYVARGMVHLAFAGHGPAIADFRKFIELEPKSAWGYSCLAWVLATCPDPRFRNGREAVEAATRACENSGWNDPNHLVDLAAANAERGDFDAAVKWQTKALELVGSQDAGLGRAMLELFRKKTPYRALPKDRKSRSAGLGLPDLRMTAG